MGKDPVPKYLLSFSVFWVSWARRRSGLPDRPYSRLLRLDRQVPYPSLSATWPFQICKESRVFVDNLRLDWVPKKTTRHPTLPHLHFFDLPAPPSPRDT